MMGQVLSSVVQKLTGERSNSSGAHTDLWVWIPHLPLLVEHYLFTQQRTKAINTPLRIMLYSCCHNNEASLRHPNLWLDSPFHITH